MPTTVRDVTHALLGMATEWQPEKLPVDQPQPGLPWAEGLRLAREAMAREANARGFAIVREDHLGYDPHHAEFSYWVETGTQAGRKLYASVRLDANDGAVRGVAAPTDERAGDVVTDWLYALHMAQVWGLPFRIFVCVMGLAVAVLSVTGVVIWWRKRRARERIETRRGQRRVVGYAE